MSAQSCPCEEVIPLLDAYHDGELSGAEESLVSSHLVSCSTCPSRLKEIENLIGSLQGLPKLVMANDLSADSDFLKKALGKLETTASASGKSVGQNAEKIGQDKKDVVEFTNKPLLPRSNVFGPLAIAAVSAAAAITLAVTIPPMLHNQKTVSPAVALKTAPALEPNVKVAKETAPVLNQSSQSEKLEAEREAAKTALARVSIHPDLALHEHRDLIHNHAANDGSLQAMMPPQTSGQSSSVSEADIANATTNNTDESSAINGGDSDKSSAPTEIASAGSPAIMPSDDRDSVSEQPEILAAYPTDSGSAPEELGLSTDEDGLYAFKM
jgi:anti-sigma factor RsiW